jgi:ParB family chromosome partitioning protein
LKATEEQVVLAEEIIRRSLTVREAEKLVANHFTQNGAVRPTRSGGGQRVSPMLTPALLHVQNRLQQHLATHVTLQHGDKRGNIEIEYYGNDDLQRILSVLGLGADEE